MTRVEGQASVRRTREVDHNFTIVRREHDAGTDWPGPGRRWDVEVTRATLWRAGDDPVAEPVPGVAPASVEGCLLPWSRRLVPDFPVAGFDRAWLAYLEQRIARNPRDLEAHVRRILQARRLGDDDGVCGALLDLYVVLGSRGRRLRSRLLAMVRDRLDPARFDFFSRAVRYRVGRSHPPAVSGRSRLSDGIRGKTAIVLRTGAGNPPAIELARELLGRGRRREARRLLAGKLARDPGNAEACDAFLDACQRGDDGEGFRDTYVAQLGRTLAKPERWTQLAARLFAPHSRDA